MTGFAMPSREAKNGFFPRRLCFVAAMGTKQLGNRAALAGARQAG
jgi:hypothetical protein